MPPAPIIAAAGKPWRGVVVALLVGMSFAANTSLAAVAYSGGATPIAVLLARTATAFLVLYLVLITRGVRRSLPAPQRRQAVLIGLIFTTYSFGILVAIQYLPVGLVVATFYTFPILIALVEWWSGRQAFSIRTALAFAIAFVGIVCALNVFGAKLHGLGVALCLMSAVAVTMVMTLSARLRSGGDSRPITLHMLGVALGIFTVIVLVHGGAALPHTDYAWFGFLAGPLFYTFGIITLFVVYGDIGAVKTSMLLNIEPVTSVVLGFLLLDQRLAPVQLFGIALVVGAVLWVESANRDLPR
jgi:drug/metabolite transporter (DMT)-like permease